MDLRRMAVFATVVRAGSMRRARTRPDPVHRQPADTPAGKGNRDHALLRRTTRRLSLTDAGQAFHEGCVAMLDAARSAHARLAELHDEVVGELTVSAPVGFAAAHLATAMQPLLAAHPRLTLRLVVTDDYLDLAREHIDVAIVIGTKPPASSLVRRHLATWDNVLVASPAYLKRHGTPGSPDDLTRHAFIALPPWHHGGDVLTGPGGARHRLTITPHVVTNNQLTIRQLTLAGCGVSFNVVPEIGDDLKRGRLVRVLPKWSAPPLSVEALMLPRKTQPAKVRQAVDALVRYLATT
jgi:DNA-binding transcriptional LysR family regulator